MNPISKFIPLSNDRLKYIEFSLVYKGEISRANLMDTFGIKEASATRDLNQYIEISDGKNSTFDKKTKKHIINDNNFTPIFNISDIDALCWIKTEKIDKSDVSYTYRCQRINLPAQSEFSPITRAITQKKKVEIEYLSPNNGKSKRIIAPHSLFDDGLRIYIRAYDSKYNKFISFAPSRITHSQLLENDIENNQKIENDQEWENFIELELIPHPKIKYRETIEYEYKMSRGCLKLLVREATAGFYLRAWNVDCTTDGSLSSDIYHLHLKNASKYSNSNFMILAPTY